MLPWGRFSVVFDLLVVTFFWKYIQYGHIWKTSFFITLWGAPGAILPQGSFFVDFEHMVFIFFWKYINLQSIDIQYGHIWKTSLFIALWEATRGYFDLRWFFCWFWVYGCYIVLKVHKICNWLIYYLTIFGNFDFSPYGEPPEGNFFPRGYARLCFDCLPCFFLLSWCKKHLSQISCFFHNLQFLQYHVLVAWTTIFNRPKYFFHIKN